MTEKGKLILEKFKELFPNLVTDTMTVREFSKDFIIINPVAGKRGRKYTFVLRRDGSWDLSYD